MRLKGKKIAILVESDFYEPEIWCGHSARESRCGRGASGFCARRRCGIGKQRIPARSYTQ